jgi:hypothetical protein
MAFRDEVFPRRIAAEIKSVRKIRNVLRSPRLALTRPAR